MKYLLMVAGFFLLGFYTKESAAQSPVERPKLVVGIVIDQMRWDYLYRFQERYSDKGFKRLMTDGYNCENTMINYLPTFTAPGHASIYTGSVPALHGIVGNDWVDNRTGKSWYCTEDTSVKSIGGGKAGLMSPNNLWASTITDELRLATNFQSRVFAISIKDRGAILPGGHTANAAFWYDGETGDFITSSYYLQKLPDWVSVFNKRNLNDSLMNLNWNTLFPISTYVQSTADDNNYEGVVKGEEKPVFLHLTSLAVKRKDKGAIRTSPFGNSMTRLMAQACIAGEKLGQGNNTDFLAISFSSPDYIGHQYGPNSIEVEDSYLRLDKELGLLFDYLDKAVGKGNYTLFLTADHGGAHNAGFLTDHKIPAKSVSIKEINKDLNQYLMQQFGVNSLVKSLMNYQVLLDEDLIKSNKMNRRHIRQEIIKWLKMQPGVTEVLDMESPERLGVALLKERSANGYNSNRCGSIQIILNPGWYSGYAPTGTTHGSWNPYDAHIPLIWYGWGIKKGKTFRQVNMVDIAPTLAALLHIQMPNACIGKVIEDVLK